MDQQSQGYRLDLTQYSIMDEAFETTGTDAAGNPITFSHMHWWHYGERPRTIYWRTNQWREIAYEGELFHVHRYNLLASTWRDNSLEGVYYDVYQKIGRMSFDRHSTIHHGDDDDQYYGKYSTLVAPDEIRALPSGPERSQRYGAWHNYLHERSKNIARAAFPEYAALEPFIEDWYI